MGGIIYGLIPDLLTIFDGKPDVSAAQWGYSNFTGMILAYFIAAYLKKYKNQYFDNRFLMTCTALALFLLLLLVCLVSKSVRGEYLILEKLTGIYGPFALFTATVMFCIFKNINWHSRVVNIFAHTTFGVYLISDNSFVRVFLWHEWLPNGSFADTTAVNYLIVVLLGALLVYVICSLIDLVGYQLIFG